jgi:chlorite dismutase
MVLYSEAELDELHAEVESLADGFDRYDTHVDTSLYRGTQTDRAAVVSLWETADAAETAGGYLSDLPGVVRRAGEGSGFGTMGMFYTVKPEHREEFVERFETVGGLLAELEGHHETDLMVNVEDENDMFIASQWGSKEDAMGFFRSDDFRETVQWGRDVLADRPRHVFLA